MQSVERQPNQKPSSVAETQGRNTLTFLFFPHHLNSHEGKPQASNQLLGSPRYGEKRKEAIGSENIQPYDSYLQCDFWFLVQALKIIT